MATLSDKIGDRLAGRYRLERELGKGGMATAYLAHDGSLDCPVVIKSPHASLLTDPTFARRFQQEMRSLVQLNHPHIVKVTDVGEHEGLPFFVMQYLSGGSLRDRQGRPKTPQPPGQLRSWLPKIAEALDFMHGRGYVHRDVKPANILFDEHEYAYLSDFGVAKAVQQDGETDNSSSLTGTGMVLGTPDYLAPEVILGKKSDGRADQYALAIAVYELLGGRCPFEGPTPTAVLVQHSAAAPPPLKKLLPHLPEALCAAVHRGLAKKPQERYPTCRAFADAVLAALNTPPTAAPTDTGGIPDAWIAEAQAPLPPSPLEIPRALCPQCGKSLKLPEESAGRSVACPACQARLTVSLDRKLLTRVGATYTTAARLPTATAGSGAQRTLQLTGATPPATNMALENPAWYRLPWVQATLVGLVLVAGISLGALWRNEPQDELVIRPAPVIVPTASKPRPLQPAPRPTVKPSPTPTPQPVPTPTATPPKPPVSVVLPPAPPPLPKPGDLQSNSIGMRLAYMPPGEFLMGSPDGDAEAEDDEKPQHKVRINKSFYLGSTEVTQGQWQAVMGTEPWKGGSSVREGPDYPATYVNWEDATEFSRKLSVKEGKQYRLPTEAEWEYACRAGTTTKYSFGDDESQLGDYAWYEKSANDRGESFAHTVGQKKPNPWGLYDLHGNVWEWCGDRYDEKYYGQSPASDPSGPVTGSNRVRRGGSWSSGPRAYCRSAHRNWYEPSFRYINLGFRVVLVLSETPSAAEDSQVPAQSILAEKSPTAAATASIPPLLIAPFDAATAWKHQTAWAKHLGSTVETTNSVRAKMVLIPSGEFAMGSSMADIDKVVAAASWWGRKEWLAHEQPRHPVRITKPFLLWKTEVTVGQFKKFSATGYKTEAEKVTGSATYLKPGYAITDESPAAMISWNDAVAFCQWLSIQEQKMYRLPTEAEWEYACRAGTTTQYSFGDDAALLEQYARQRQRGAYPVGAKLPNRLGLHDMHGNLWEWCQDFYDEKWYEKSPLDDPSGPEDGFSRVRRGGSWDGDVFEFRTANRDNLWPSFRDSRQGFRCVQILDASTVAPPKNVPLGNSNSTANSSPSTTPSVTATTTQSAAQITPLVTSSPITKPSGPAPSIAKAPFDAAQAKAHQTAWAEHLGTKVETENTIGMRMTLLPPGEFQMGSPVSDTDASADEHPQHKVSIVNPFYLGTHEVTRGQFARFISSENYRTEAERDGKGGNGLNSSKKFEQSPKYTWRNSGWVQTDEDPVVNVSWNDATAFCAWLSAKEGKLYRLPTEAEFEYACRAGTTTKYYHGDDPEWLAAIGNVADGTAKATFSKFATIESRDGYVFTAPVGRFQANRFGLYDMTGNVWEWCGDLYDKTYYSQSPVSDPTGPLTGSPRVFRGGGWGHSARFCRSAYRFWFLPSYRNYDLGFRVVAVQSVGL